VVVRAAYTDSSSVKRPLTQRVALERLIVGRRGHCRQIARMVAVPRPVRRRQPVPARNSAAAAPLGAHSADRQPTGLTRGPTDGRRGVRVLRRVNAHSCGTDRLSDVYRLS
jgi:hypothetical protein